MKRAERQELRMEIFVTRRVAALKFSAAVAAAAD